MNMFKRCMKRVKQEKATIYICDGKRCEDCHPFCKHTSDVKHAKNFEYFGFGYVEKRETEKAMKIKLDDGAKMPTRAHDTDAGLDLYARETQIVPAKESAKFDTGVHVELPTVTIGGQTFNTVGMLKSKSGLNVKYGLTSEGVIDVGYTGSIVVKLYNHSGFDYKVNAGDKITQLVVMPILTPPLELVESLDDTERGAGGFGSTGK